MSFWGWVGAIAAGWFAASVLFAIMWRLVGRTIFRKPPRPTIELAAERLQATRDVVTELKRLERRTGRGF